MFQYISILFSVLSKFKNYTLRDKLKKKKGKNVYERKMIKRGPLGNSAEKRSPYRSQAYGPSWTRSLGRVERTLLLLSPSRSKSSIPPHHHYPQLPLQSPLKFFWIVTNLSFFLTWLHLIGRPIWYLFGSALHTVRLMARALIRFLMLPEH